MAECSFHPVTNKPAFESAPARSKGEARFAHLHEAGALGAKRGCALSSVDMEVARACTFKPRTKRYETPQQRSFPLATGPRVLVV